MDLDSFTRLFKADLISVWTKDRRLKYYYDGVVMYREMVTPFQCCESIYTIKSLYYRMCDNYFVMTTNLSRSSKRCLV